MLSGPVEALTWLGESPLRRANPLPGHSIITTGTLTDAQALRRGQRWQTRIGGVDLPGLVLQTD